MAENLCYVHTPPEQVPPADSDKCEELEKKGTFGTRYLDTPARVFEHNAWDDVEWSQEQVEEAEKKIALNSSSSLTAEELEKHFATSSQAWHSFYQQHHDNFFKDRNWLLVSFPELASKPTTGIASCYTLKPGETKPDPASSAEAIPLPLTTHKDTYSPVHVCTEADTAAIRILDAGCGVGNASFPILELNPTDIFIYACDFAESAINLIKTNSQFNSKRLHPFVCDLATDSYNFPFPPSSFDFVLLLFVLSAVPPAKASLVAQRLGRLLKPGGMLLFRDYGRYDMTQLRFKPGSCLLPNCYKRGDGTQAYFFTEQEVSQLFETEAGLEKVQLISDKRLQVNRGKQIKMFRVWIQAKYRKPFKT